MFVAQKSAYASAPPQKKRRRTKSDGERSVELQFTQMLRKRTDYKIEGIAPNGEPSLSLYHWRGTHWQYVYPAIAKKFALKWMETTCPDKYDDKRAKTCITTACTQMDTATAVSALEKNRGQRVIVPLKGGYLELVDGQWHILKPDPNLGMTYAVPAVIDPAKVVNGIYTPADVPPASRFGRYLHKFIPSREDQDKLAEVAAASLIPGGVEKAFLLLGGGGNGKSTFLHILEAFHPTTHTVLRLEHLGGRFGLGTISGKSLAIAWEVPPFIGSNSEQVLKSLISRDTVQAEKKNQDPISITPRATVYIAANDPPRFTDHTHGRERKFEAFAFNQKIDERKKDTGYARSITNDPAELAVALDWTLAGLSRLVKRGRFADQTESQQELTETIKLESDSTYAYLKNEIVVLPPADEYAKRWWGEKQTIYTAYREATLQKGQKPVAAPQFWRSLKARIEDRGQSLDEMRGGPRSQRVRLVNLTADPNDIEDAECWIEAKKNLPAVVPASYSDTSDIPF